MQMKVLWITTSDTFYYASRQSTTNTYNGVGWVASQQLEVMKCADIKLGIMFLTQDKNACHQTIDGVEYYPIVCDSGKLHKIIRYYLYPDKSIFGTVKQQVDAAVKNFSPAIIHVFGLECPLSELIEYSPTPHIIHLQGLMSPCKESYYPPGINHNTISRYGSFRREHVLKNGFGLGYKRMYSGAIREQRLCQSAQNLLGRTKWDKSVMSLYAPSARYHHLDEILRPEFYESFSTVKKSKLSSITITSTLSPVLYKGLDLIIKTCSVLENLGINYVWNVIGIDTDSGYEKLIRKALSLSGQLNIHYNGVTDAQGIIQVLSETDVYVHPSYIDNSPNSLCEAQILGVPVIATYVGGVPSLIDDGKTGILIPANEPHALAASLVDLMKNPELRMQLSASGRETALRRHDKSRIIADLRNIYNALITPR